MNYDLLFQKCAKHDINLNWLIYGEESSPILNFSENKEKKDLHSDSFEEQVIKYVQIIQSLPWPVSVKRKILENYIAIVHEETEG